MSPAWSILKRNIFDGIIVLFRRVLRKKIQWRPLLKPRFDMEIFNQVGNSWQLKKMTIWWWILSPSWRGHETESATQCDRGFIHKFFDLKKQSSSENDGIVMKENFWNQFSSQCFGIVEGPMMLETNSSTIVSLSSA